MSIEKLKKEMGVHVIINKIKNAYGIKTNLQLAKRLEITLSAIDAWKRNRNVPDKYIFHCINETKTSLDYFFYEDKLASDNSIAKNDKISLDDDLLYLFKLSSVVVEKDSKKKNELLIVLKKFIKKNT
jgi:transcriptional regulator with XRE-family HTH domain